MKHRLSYIAIIIATIAGVGIAYAKDNTNGNNTSNPTHYTYSEWAFSSGSGFSSGPESYAGQGSEARVAVSNLVTKSAPTGHSFTQPEYLFFSGKGFSSN